MREALRSTATDPSQGEPLQDELAGYLKYRVRRYRIVYRPHRAAGTVTVMTVGHRRTVYEEAAAALRSRSG